MFVFYLHFRSEKNSYKMRAHCARTERERLLWRPFVGLICQLGAKELTLVKLSLAFFPICDHIRISKDELTLEAQMSHLYEHLCRL